MSASSRLFQHERERHLVEVPGSYYDANFEFFKYPKTKHILTIVTSDEKQFEDDEQHSKLVKIYMKAKKELEIYKFNKRKR